MSVASCPRLMLQPPTVDLATNSTPPSPTMKRKQFTLPGISMSPAPTSSLTVTQTQRNKPQSSTKAPRRKLGPGCGLLDWIRLCRNKKADLAGNGGTPRPITEEELAKHNTPDDAWTAIRGKVYNLTPYMKFHPGGTDDLMKGAGKDCTILFDEVHKWVNVESMMKACYVGPLETTAPTNRPSGSTRQRSDTLTVAKPTAVTGRLGSGSCSEADGVKKHSPCRKTSMELRTQTQAAHACEEPDGVRQVSPESPSKPLVQEIPKKLFEQKEKQAAEDTPPTLIVPAHRTRKNSDASRPNPKFGWTQSERSINIHVNTHCATVKTSDVLVDVDGQTLEAAIFINDWVYEMKLEMPHTIVSSQVSINGGRVEISLKKETNQEQWEDIGTFEYRHITAKNKRDLKYHSCSVESIKSVTYDTKLFTLRLKAGSFLQVPTGHHVSIKATVDGEEVEREYTPVTTFMESANRQPQAQYSSTTSETIQMMIKLYKNGKMSSYLEKLKVGDQVLVSDSDGTFDASRLAHTTDILLVAAGTGFTPMVRVLNDSLCTPENRCCKAKLLFANKAEEDILWKNELEQLCRTTQDRFQVTHVLSAASSEWTGTKGRIDSSLLKSHLPGKDTNGRSKSLVCICGPSPFTTAISNYLLDIEYPEENIHCFT